jgi:hypothetical protein
MVSETFLVGCFWRVAPMLAVGIEVWLKFRWQLDFYEI